MLNHVRNLTVKAALII